jgi:hypothetical protein
VPFQNDGRDILFSVIFYSLTFAPLPSSIDVLAFGSFARLAFASTTQRRFGCRANVFEDIVDLSLASDL